MNDILSICIPTYNRAEVLRGCLENIIPQVKKHDIPIYISDNASGDNTAEVISAACAKYPYIFYLRNSQNLGADINIERVLKMTKSKYAWLFGDKYRLFPGSIDIVLARLTSLDCDLMVVNSSNKPNSKENVHLRVKDIPGPTIYTDANKLLGDLGWHMTLISSLIFSSKLIYGADFNKYSGTQFVQVASIFGYFANKKNSIFWVASPLFYGCEIASGWQVRTFDVFMRKWFVVIDSLPAPYTEEAKMQCIKDHGIKSGLFSFRNLLALRGQGHFNYGIYKNYEFYFPYITDVPRAVLIFISLMPAFPYIVFKRIRGALMGIKQENA